MYSKELLSKNIMLYYQQMFTLMISKIFTCAKGVASEKKSLRSPALAEYLVFVDILAK